VDFACRRCGFVYPEVLRFLTSAEISEKDPKKLEGKLQTLFHARESVIVEKFQEQGVLLTKEAFLRLDEKVRSRKILPAVVHKASVAFFSQLLSVGEALQKDKDRETWGSFVHTLEFLKEKEIQNDTERRIALASFSAQYDTLLSRIQTLWHDFQIADKQKEPYANANVQSATDGFLRSTEDPFFAIQNITNLFAVGAEQVAQNNLNNSPDVKKWFTSINRNHKNDLEKIWDEQATVGTATLRRLDKLSESAQNDFRAALDRFSHAFGTWRSAWSRIKPNRDLQHDEWVLALRWSTLTFLERLLEGDEVDPVVHIHLNVWILDSLKTIDGMIQKYQLSDVEIKERIVEREERERDFFIRKLDMLDRDMRKIELMKKKYGLGDWNVASKNLFSYNSDWWEHEREQRAAMGYLPGFGDNVTNAVEADPAAQVNPNPYGDTNDHRVAEAEDE
jgi:hypothetical protein